MVLAPVVVAGALLGRWIMARLNQRAFEELMLARPVGANQFLDLDKGILRTPPPEIAEALTVVMVG